MSDSPAALKAGMARSSRQVVGLQAPPRKMSVSCSGSPVGSPVRLSFRFGRHNASTLYSKAADFARRLVFVTQELYERGKTKINNELLLEVVTGWDLG